MINISSLAQFDFYKNFVLVAGKEGLFNPISNVVILEYESMLQDYSGFSEGNFVLTSLFFARENPQLISDAFAHLIQKGVSGIAVKTAYYDKIPDSAVSLANDKNIPLFLFHDVYMEDIIIGVNRLQEWSERSEYYEEQIHELVSQEPKEDSSLALARQMNPDFRGYLTALYWEPSPDDRKDSRIYNQMIYRKNKLTYAERIFITRYYDGYIFLFHFDDMISSKQAKVFMHKVIKELNLPEANPIYALCEIPHPVKELSQLFMKCFYTDIARRLSGIKQACYEDIGIHQMILPVLINPITREVFANQLSLLQDYDDTKKGYLLDTLLAYVAHDMQINATADELFQHPNTVRYRLEKAKDLLGLNSFAFSMSITCLVELYKLQHVTIPYPL